MTAPPNANTPAGRAIAHAWRVASRLEGFVPTRLLAAQPQHIRRARVAAVQSQTAEAWLLGTVEAENK